MIETTHKIKCDRCGLVLEEYTEKEWANIDDDARDYVLHLQDNKDINLVYKILCTKCTNVTNRLVRELMPVRKMRKTDED